MPYYSIKFLYRRGFFKRAKACPRVIHDSWCTRQGLNQSTLIGMPFALLQCCSSRSIEQLHERRVLELKSDLSDRRNVAAEQNESKPDSLLLIVNSLIPPNRSHFPHASFAMTALRSM
jgi:hypothetical protein